MSCHRFVYVLPELLFSPFGVGILLPIFDPEVPVLVTAVPLPAGSGAGTLCSTWVLRRFIVQPAGPIR